MCYIYMHSRKYKCKVNTRFAISLNCRHSPKALTRLIKFFLGSGLASASIIGLRGFEKKRIIWQGIKHIKDHKIHHKTRNGLWRKTQIHSSVQSSILWEQCIVLNLWPNGWILSSSTWVIFKAITFQITTIVGSSIMELHSRRDNLQQVKNYNRLCMVPKSTRKSTNEEQEIYRKDQISWI